MGKFASSVRGKHLQMGKGPILTASMYGWDGDSRPNGATTEHLRHLKGRHAHTYSHISKETQRKQ